MNILYIHTHDSGRYFQHYGWGDSPTNNLSRWARKETLSFRNAFAASPTCSPSRASLLTGQYPHSNGMLGLAHRGFRLNSYDNHMVRFLKKEGYRTVLCGVQHEGAHCFDHEEAATVIGYDEDISSFIDRESLTGDTTVLWDRENADQAAHWLSRSHDKPSSSPTGCIPPTGISLPALPKTPGLSARPSRSTTTRKTGRITPASWNPSKYSTSASGPLSPLWKKGLMDDPAYQVVAGELAQLLREWQVRTADPLLEGEYAAPAGAIVNRAECVVPDSADPEDYL